MSLMDQMREGFLIQFGVVPMDDMELILRQMWKSRQTEPKMGELYEKYLKLTTFE